MKKTIAFRGGAIASSYCAVLTNAAPLFARYLPAAKSAGAQTEKMWQDALNQRALVKMRFREGAQVQVVAGDHAGQMIA